MCQSKKININVCIFAYKWNMHDSCVTNDLLSVEKNAYLLGEFMRNSVVC